MDKRRLGRSDLPVGALGLGCMAIGGAMMRGETPQEHTFYLGEVSDTESIHIIQHAVDLGVTFFDTAPAYGAGNSERLLGMAFSGRRHEITIATKFGKKVDEGRRWFGFYKDEDEVIAHIRHECVASLQRLNTDYIDLYQFHLLDFPLERAAEVREILESLVVEGKIRHYAWSTDDPARAQLFAEGEHCVAVQHHMNVLQDAPGLLAVCDTYDLASIVRGPLASGFLSGKYSADNIDTALSQGDFRLQSRAEALDLIGKLPAVRDVLTSGGRTLVQGALAWIWARSPHAIPIPGFRTLAQVEENCAALAYGPLTPAQMHEINVILDRQTNSANVHA
jgi:aryl-alcohol dehydrogenase-like predicted oxidoreductase